MDGLGHDLSVADDIGIGPVTDLGAIRVIRPLKERKLSLDQLRPVTEPAVGQLLAQLVGLAPQPVMASLDTVRGKYDQIVGVVAGQVLLDGALEARAQVVFK
nr:hypothetical protein [Blastococcus sp. DSM 46838]